MKAPTTLIHAAHGITFLARLVRQGDPYGMNFGLSHGEEKPVVEFYDTRYPFDYDFIGTLEEAKAAGATCLGQFVSRHYLDTLREFDGFALALHGGIADWQIDAPSIAAVVAKFDRIKDKPHTPEPQPPRPKLNPAADRIKFIGIG
jgi:hypothetical protein